MEIVEPLSIFMRPPSTKFPLDNGFSKTLNSPNEERQKNELERCVLVPLNTIPRSQVTLHKRLTSHTAQAHPTVHMWTHWSNIGKEAELTAKNLFVKFHHFDPKSKKQTLFWASFWGLFFLWLVRAVLSVSWRCCSATTNRLPWLALGRRTPCTATYTGLKLLPVMCQLRPTGKTST